MATARKSRLCERTRIDWISDLPSCIIENILMRLPIRDAARTSILSKKWRYKWTTIPQIVLDDSVLDLSAKKDASAENQPFSRQKFVSILHQILTHHQGPIFRFYLSITELKYCPEINDLVLLLSSSGLKDLSLKLWLGEHYEMPSSFYFYQELTKLNLWSCSIRPPAGFKGFSQLISLKLSQVRVGSRALQRFISSCPLLQELKLQTSEDLNCLEIIAPRLKSLTVKSVITSIFFKNTPVLAIVSLVLDERGADELYPKGGKGMIEHFVRLPNLEKIQLDYQFIKLLSAGGIPTRLTSALIHLKVIKLSFISLDAVNEISFVLCLLRSSPNLLEIEISVYHGVPFPETPISDLLNVLDYSDFTFTQLREVKLQYITGTRSEMELIKLLLEKSPVLEKMLIETRGEEDQCKILKDLNTYRRASRYAKVIYDDSDEH